MIRSQARSIPIEPIILRYLGSPKDFQNNQRLLQIENLVTETVEFNARQIINLTIVNQMLVERPISINHIDVVLRRHSAAEALSDGPHHISNSPSERCSLP